MTVLLSDYTQGADVHGYAASRLVLVEGGDDQQVVRRLIESLALSGSQVHDMNGNAGWGSAVKGIVPDRRFRSNVEGLALIRDADRNAASTFDSCRATLRNANLPVPSVVEELSSGRPRTGIYVFEDGQGKGALEDLCLMSFDARRLECVDDYGKCLAELANRAPTSSKSRVQTYLSGLPRECRSIRVAAEQGQIDVANSAFDRLRRFLESLATS